MKGSFGKSEKIIKNLNLAKQNAKAIVSAIHDPSIILDNQFFVVSTNKAFQDIHHLDGEEIIGHSFFKIKSGTWENPVIRNLLEKQIPETGVITNFEFFHIQDQKETLITLNGSTLQLEELDQKMILLSFREVSSLSNFPSRDKVDFKNLQTIFDQTPAMICTLAGPDHVFELANTKYLKLLGNRDVIGKTVREVVPEIEGQGFFEILDNVYKTGIPFVGKEIPIELKGEDDLPVKLFLNFVYQPILNDNGRVKGIFVHAIDFTEQVQARKKVEESENHLRNLIDTLPVIIWFTDQDGKSTYLNKNWFEYTGQNSPAAQGFGWLEAVHPEDSEIAKENFFTANKERRSYSSTYRLTTKNGNYRWVIDKGRPKFDVDGNYEGMVGTVVDVHEEKVKEQLIIEKEHRIRSIIEEAPIATAVYTGIENKIEFANDVMIRLWGKDRSVVGKTLSEALPELDGQPFEQLLKEVYETGNTYWGKEQVVDLLIDNRMQSGYFNFSYKPLYDVKGEIYGILNMAQEVTEIVESKTLLKESEAHFRQMADLMPTKVTNTNAQGNFIYFNQGWLDYTGLSLEELQTQGWIRFIHPDHKQQFEKLWEHSLQTGEDLEMEIKCLNRNGEYKWHINRAEAVKDESGKIKMWIGATIDIQEQKEVMENLEYSKALLEAHNQANLDGVLLVDTRGERGEIISFNHRFIKIWNMPQRIIDSRNDDAALEFAEKQLISPDQFLDKVKYLYKTNSSTQVHTDVLRFKDGKIIERFGYPMIGEDGTFYAWSWTFRDITEMERSKSLLKESESHFRQMADLMPTKVANTDAEGNFIYFNQSWLDYTGNSTEELKIKGWHDLIHPKEKKEFLKRWQKSISTGSDFEMELRCLNKNGKYKWHLARAEAVKDEPGNIKMWIGTNTEIQKLKEEEKRKGDFLKMVSHELKTPVTSIKGYVQLLLSILNRDSGKEIKLSSLPLQPSLERIDHQIRRLTRLISEMLDLSRIEDNKLELQKEVFSLNDLVKETVQDINYTNTQHRIDILHNFQCNVYADKDRIGQVLINFITNAIKYSPENQDVEVRIDQVSNGQVSVSVKDQGIGIDKKFHKNIFKRFYRIGVKSEETYSGFGIGLYLANEIIQRHKGYITVNSKKGKGSEFLFTLNIDSKNNTI
jgi:PAS domain S-box-containing protein